MQLQDRERPGFKNLPLYFENRFISILKKNSKDVVESWEKGLPPDQFDLPKICLI